MRNETPRPRRLPRRVAGRTIRIDVNAPETPEEAEGRITLLRLFRGLLGVPDRDRRVMTRHEADAFSVWLGWYRGDGDFFAVAARVVNLSRGGAQIIAADPPPERHPVWLCLASPEPTDCIEARVLEVRRFRGRECTLRLKFARPCPHAFFEAAICRRPKAAKGRTPGRPVLEGDA